jgi:hypothetical protein
MSTFIKLDDGSYIARDRITRIAPSEFDQRLVEYIAADGSARKGVLASPLEDVLGATTILPAAGECRVLRVQLADANAPPVITATPVIGWRVLHATGEIEPLTPLADLDVRSPECCIEPGNAPGVISQGVAYVRLDAFVEARRDAIRAAAAARQAARSQVTAAASAEVAP